MQNWKVKIELKDLFTEKEDHESVQKSMSAIADRIKDNPHFMGFSTTRFYNIPKGDEVIAPVDYANKLLAMLYDFADDQRIWIA